MKHERSSRSVDYSPLKRAGAVGLAALTLAGGVRALKDAHDSKSDVQPITLEGGPYRVYTIQPGDTLWGIAKEAFPDAKGDIRETIAKIREEQPETIDPGALEPGDTLYLEPDAHVGVPVDASKDISVSASSADEG